MNRRRRTTETDNEERFSTLFRTYGGPLQIETLPPDTQQRYVGQIGFYREFDPSIRVEVLINETFNAIASPAPYGDFIGLYHGTITQLTLYAFLVFSDPEVFSSIGDSRAEALEPSLIERVKDGNLRSIVAMRFMPNDPIRRNVAERIAECACLILFLHEAAHIRGCHVELIRDQLGYSEHQEFSIRPISQEESVLVRTLELEADTVALVNGLNIWRGLGLRSGVHDVEVLGPTRSWLIASELLFWVMSFNHDQLRDSQLASHPSLLTRFQNIRTLRGTTPGKEDDELIAANRDPGNTLFPWIDKHGLSSPLACAFRDQLPSSVRKEWEELRCNIQALWPRLSEYEASREGRLGALSA